MFDLLQTALPMAEMKTVSAPGASSLFGTPELTVVGAIVGVAALAIYVFMR